jgi:hypothetical protein
MRGGLEAGGAIGALFLSYTLYVTDSYAPFLILSAATTIIGALCFFATGAGRFRANPYATDTAGVSIKGPC